MELSLGRDWGPNQRVLSYYGHNPGFTGNHNPCRQVADYFLYSSLTTQGLTCLLMAMLVATLQQQLRSSSDQSEMATEIFGDGYPSP